MKRITLSSALGWAGTAAAVASPFASIYAFELIFPEPSDVTAIRGMCVSVLFAAAALIAVLLRVRPAGK